jgi:hypothetical protein
VSISLTTVLHILSSISDAFCAANACVSSHQDPLPNHQQSGQVFAIISASGTLHTPHFDPNGQITFLHIQEGFKLLVVGIYKGKLSKLPNFPDSSVDLWDLLRMSDMKIRVAIAGPGRTAYACLFFSHLHYALYLVIFL